MRKLIVGFMLAAGAWLVIADTVEAACRRGGRGRIFHGRVRGGCG